MAIAANRFKGVRAAPCWSTEVAQLAREHNFANILCLGARLITPDDGVAIFDRFVSEPESSELRHQRRVKKMDSIGDTQVAGRTAH
jgi:ribose 5-phosphate isomerase B